MSAIAVVTDASALISLEEINLLDRVAPLFSECVIPPTVEREIAPSVRLVAAALGLPVIGTIGILVLAKQSGIISVARPHFEALRETGFFISEALIEHALVIADEAM